MPNLSETPVKVSPDIQTTVPSPKHPWYTSLWQIMRFSTVGVLNTVIDVITLNTLLWLFPTHNANLLLFYNSIAYTVGALNSFGLNKYWTFKSRHRAIGGEILRFAIVNVAGILCSDGILWIVARTLHPLITNNLLWANASKGSAILGTAMVSYFGMRLWVFASKPHETKKKPDTEPTSHRAEKESAISRDQMESSFNKEELKAKHSLSVILPAYNEEAAIAGTVQSVVDTLSQWVPDFEVIVVNDGSKDSTPAIVEAIVAANPHVRLISHPVNQGYGATLVTGFEAVTKDLAFFMDSDGQFDIHDLERFFSFIDEYDAVLGYRINRQDTWMRKLNAWGWKMLVRMVFGLRVRDVDCAFKLYRAEFFRTHRLETHGAMINTEILYKFTRAGYTYTQLGVRHLPRKGGRATGAKPAVILRAFRELAVYALKWRREEREEARKKQVKTKREVDDPGKQRITNSGR